MSFSRVLVVTTMLLAFIGQTLAYDAMSCDMSNNSDVNSMAMDHSNMDHSMGTATDMTQMNHDSQIDDCCDIDCECPSNVVSSQLLLNTNTFSDRIQLREASYFNVDLLVNSSFQQSLYRPPIFA